MDKIRFQEIVRRALLVPFGTALFLALVLIFEVQYLVNRADWVERTDQVITISQRLYRTRVDQESGLRAYLLTDDERFLQAFHEGLKDGEQLEAQLQQFIADDAEQQARNERVTLAYNEWFSWADQAMAMAKRGEDAGDPAFQLRGKALMDQQRARRAEFINHAVQLRAEGLAASRHTVRFVNVSIVVLCVLVASAFAVFGRKQMMSLSQSFNAALDAAKATSARLAGIVESAMDAIITVDEKQRIVLFNHAAEQIFRCFASDAVGQPLDKFIPERFRDAHRRHVHDFGHTGVTNRSMHRPGTLWAVRSDGQEFPIEATISQVEAEGQKLFTVILRDITERKENEEALRNAEKLVAIGQMASMLAHEINNPLAAIVNIAYIVRSYSKLPTKLQAPARLLNEELERLSRIVRQTLGLHREHGVSSPPIRPAEVIDDVLKSHRKLLRAISIDRRYECDALVNVDSLDFHQLVSNLLLNAAEAMRDSRGSIKIHVRESSDWRNSDRSGIRITVADSGVGMDAETRRRMLEPFFTTKRQKGSGLGLTVVQWVAAKYDGSIHVRTSTRPGRSGTCVSVFLATTVAKRVSEPTRRAAQHSIAS
jgi:PAS domain S-box-containing protein